MKYVLIIFFSILFVTSLSCGHSQKDKTAKTDTTSISDEIVDIDGNVYHTIKIANQTWMTENLKVTHYRNGDSIENIKDSPSFQNKKTGAFCDYKNDSTFKTKYGRYYNWYAVNDKRNICPIGWHVPSPKEWKTLIFYNVSSKIPYISDEWNPHEKYPQLKRLFNIFSGYCVGGNSFGQIDESSFYWTSDTTCWHSNGICISVNDSSFIKCFQTIYFGVSVRCIKDE